MMVTGKRTQRAQPTVKPTVLDLFSGAGGLSHGFRMADYEICYGIESDRLAASTHAYNFHHPAEPVNITAIADPLAFIEQHELRRPDVIIGGPPCQGFSRVGRGKLRNLRNDPTYIHDPRNLLYQEFVRFVEVLTPLYFVMENVPDLQFYNDGDGLLLDKLVHYFRHELGYETDCRVLSAHHYGVPQTRERLIIIGNRLHQELRWPEPTHEAKPTTVWQAIGDMPIIAHGHRVDEIPYEPRGTPTDYQQQMRAGAGDTLTNHQTRWHNDQDLEAFAWLPEGGKYVDLPPEYQRYRVDIFADKYRKLYRGKPSWTVEAHIGKDTYRHIYPSLPDRPEPPRTISVREAARLQSFPDSFRFLGPFTRQFYQVGNAVPPLLAKAIAEAIRPGVLAGMNAASVLAGLGDAQALGAPIEQPQRSPVG